jgi:hypothetical protein
VNLFSVNVLVLSVVVAFSGNICSLGAQKAPISPPTGFAQCAQWIKSTVSGQIKQTLDPTHFCAGIQDGSTGAWFSSGACEGQADRLSDAPPTHCTSSGRITRRETWAAGFRSSTIDGHEFFDESSNAPSDSYRSSAMFFSRTALWIEKLRLPAGMYWLKPLKSTDAWRLTIVNADQEENDATLPQQYLGSVQLKDAAAERRDAASSGHVGNVFLISIKSRGGDECRSLAKASTASELHFIYGNTDLYVCISPDEVPLDQGQSLSPR